MCVTMSCRWESSKRPLFVKQVWQDGYRHAILSEEDPALKKNIKSPRSTSTRKLERPKSKREGEEILAIPTVQLLLANVRRLKRRENNKNAQQTRDKLQKSFTFDVILRNEAKITPKSFVFDLEAEDAMYSAFSIQKTPITSINAEQSNSLTERVLLWLDLAGKYNNNKYPEEIKVKKRTNRPCQISTPHVEDTLKIAEPPEPIIYQNYDDNICKFEEEYETKNNDISESSILRVQPIAVEVEPNNVSVSVPEIEQEEDEYRTAKVEQLVIKNTSDEINNKLTCFSKRQVHIFIPNIKKITEIEFSSSFSSEYKVNPDETVN